jgi:transcriptional regulator with XRE-family HTH domain
MTRADYGPAGPVFGHSRRRAGEGMGPWAGRVDALITCMGWTQKEYARWFGMTYVAVKNIRSGRFRPPVEFIRRLAMLEEMFAPDLRAQQAKTDYENGSITRREFNREMERWVAEHNERAERLARTRRPADLASVGAVGAADSVPLLGGRESRPLKLVRIPVARGGEAGAHPGERDGRSAAAASGARGVAGGVSGEAAGG